MIIFVDGSDKQISLTFPPERFLDFKLSLVNVKEKKKKKGKKEKN